MAKVAQGLESRSAAWFRRVEGALPEDAGCVTVRVLDAESRRRRESGWDGSGRK